MKLHHYTYHANEILEEGFKDTFMTPRAWRGEWFSDLPMPPTEGILGDNWLFLEIPENVVAEYEWIEEGKPYREWLIPAEVVG